MSKMLNDVLSRAANAGNVVIVGAGKKGRELLMHLEKNNSISVLCFFDNNEKLLDSYINNKKIIKPYKLKEKCLYIISVDEKKRRKELYLQLQKLNIRAEDIAEYFNYRDYVYLSSLDKSFYKKEISEMYYERFGRQMNWELPTGYNEKINWEKLNITDERRTKLADKYLVREWVEEKIGQKHLTKLYGVWDDANEIDFDKLPNSCVFKVNNGSTRNIIVKDKTKIDQKEICQQLNEWKNRNFAYSTLELHYRDIVPKIICEEYLEGLADYIYDYNIYCFHGEPMYIWCIKGSHKPECQASFYNKKWEMQEFSYGYPKDPVLAPKPAGLEEMLELSRILCRDFEHIRVDWYNLPDGRVLFGEMTFSTWSGLMHFIPEEYDEIFGKLI